MPRPVNRIPRRELKDTDPFSNYVLTLVSTSLSFNVDKVHAVPDSRDTAILETMSDWSRTRVFDAVSKQLNHDLQTAFFDEIVLERPHILEVASLLSQPKLVLVQGLTGTGKTVVCRSAREKHKRDMQSSGHKTMHLYVDMKAIVRSLGDDVDDDDYQSSTLRRAMDSELKRLFFDQSSPEARRLMLQSAADVCGDQMTAAQLSTLLSSDSTISDFLRVDGARSAIERICADTRATLYSFISALKSNGFTVSITLDNVDRLRIRPQQMLLQFAIDLVNECSIAVVFSARTPNLSRLHSEGIKGDQIWMIRLEIATGLVLEDLEQTFDVHEWSLGQESSALGANDLSYILVRRMNFLFSKPYVSKFFVTFFEHQSREYLGITERDGRATPADFARLQHGINKATETWCTKCGLLHYFNGGIRESASFLGIMMYRIILGIDEGADFITMFLLPDAEPRRMESKLRNYFLRCLCIHKERLPKNLFVYNCFDDLFSSGTFLGMGTIRMILQESWLAPKMDLEVVEKKWADIGYNASKVRSSLSKLAHAASHGAHGAILCAGLEPAGELGHDHDGYVEVLPAGLHLDVELITTVEYLFWALLYAEWPQPLFDRLQLDTLARISTDFKILPMTRFVSRALEIIYEDLIAAEARRLDAHDPNWRTLRWTGPDVFRRMLHQLDALMKNLPPSEIEFETRRVTQLIEASR